MQEVILFLFVVLVLTICFLQKKITLDTLILAGIGLLILQVLWAIFIALTK
jgi:hypothetical protein